MKGWLTKRFSNQCSLCFLVKQEENLTVHTYIHKHSLRTSFSATLNKLMASSCIWQGWTQHAKKVVSNSMELVDFTIGLVNSVFNLPNC